MINCIKNTSVFKLLNLNKNLSHAYLFYSVDKELNNNIALNFAKILQCSNSTACGNCNSCKQFESSSHPDVSIINQDSIKVEDVNNIIAKLTTLPISGKNKVFVILNAENMNETAQNKLLKSLEEPNSCNIFILTSTKTDKLLPTILSRLNKQYVTKLDAQDKLMIAKELKNQNIDIYKYLASDFNLTEMINFETNDAYKSTLEAIKTIFSSLKTTADIPSVCSKIGNFDKSLFLPLLQDILLDCINDSHKFDSSITEIFKATFSKKAMLKCLPLVAEAYKKQMSNVNFGYILDTLLFNILKEKFLCK